MKNSNVIPSNGKYSVQIFDGLKLVCKNDNFESETDAYNSAKRIIEHQKKLSGDGMTAYAMVFGNKRMLYYFD